MWEAPENTPRFPHNHSDYWLPDRQTEGVRVWEAGHSDSQSNAESCNLQKYSDDSRCCGVCRWWTDGWEQRGGGELCGLIWSQTETEQLSGHPRADYDKYAAATCHHNGKQPSAQFTNKTKQTKKGSNSCPLKWPFNNNSTLTATTKFPSGIYNSAHLSSLE